MASAFHRMNSVRQSKARPLTDNKSVRKGEPFIVRLRLICDTVASLDARHSRKTAQVIPSPVTCRAVLCREYPALCNLSPV